MSRSKHQRHPTYRKHRRPRTILDIVFKNGRYCWIWKHIRLRPYGRKNFIGWGEEEYSKKFGDYCATQTCKKRERRLAKEQIKKDLYETYV